MQHRVELKYLFEKGTLHHPGNELDRHWVLGRTMPDLQLSLLLKCHVCIELSCQDPHIICQV